MDRKILLVEDNRFFRKTLKRIIAARFQDLKIEEAATEQRAWEKIQAFQPDIILMDIRLPDGDGIGMTRSIKSAFPDKFIIVLTNLDSEVYLEASIEAGADGFISKHRATPRAIAEVLRQILDIGK